MNPLLLALLAHYQQQGQFPSTATPPFVPQGVNWSGPYLGAGEGGYSDVRGATGVGGGSALPAVTAGTPKSGMSASQWAQILSAGLGAAGSQAGQRQQGAPMPIQAPEVAPYQYSPADYSRTNALLEALFGGQRGGAGGGYGY